MSSTTAATARWPRGLGTWGLVLAVLLGAACETRTPLRIRPGPVVREQTFAVSPSALRKVAVIPFYPAERLGQPDPGVSGAPPGPPRWESAALVGNFVSRALEARGVAVIPPNDVELAFTGEGHAVPRLDPKAAVELAARNFGVSAVVLGQVTRYREREGSAAGATRPASVAFEVSLHEVPTARRLWTGRFDETQQSITEAILRARQYPGAGTRWLTAAEFARWGADEIAKSMTSNP